ncbi:hypothetical protein [Allosphingosinicella vermicomposti]|nr:hypothetical protein [Allosphingosinicella vermicomposti]
MTLDIASDILLSRESAAARVVDSIRAFLHIAAPSPVAQHII